MIEIRTPTYIRLIGLIGADIAAREKQRFADLLQMVGAEVIARDEQNNPIVATRYRFDAVYEMHFKFLRGNDYCVHQIWATPKDDNYRGHWDEPHKLVQKVEWTITDGLLFETGVYVCSEPVEYALIEEAYGIDNGACSNLWAWFDLCAQTGSETRYWLCPVQKSPGLSPREKRRVSNVIDDIARIELYRHKIGAYYTGYQLLHSRLAKIESEVSRQIETATRDLRSVKLSTMKDTLHTISQKFIQVAEIARAMDTDANSTAANVSNLESVFRRWNEQPKTGTPSVSTLLLANAQIISAGYARLARQIESVRIEMQHVTEVIRSRVDLEQQEDILLIQRGLDWIQVIVLTDIFFRFGAEVFPQETLQSVFPITHQAQSFVLLACAFIGALIVTQGVQRAVRWKARR